MATVTLKGQPIQTQGELPKVGSKLPEFTLVKGDLSEANLAEFKGKKIVLNVFPSVDTGTCAMSVRTFNEQATELEDTRVLCISADLPFAQNRFCGAEGIKNVAVLSGFRSSFGDDYGLTFNTGPLKGLYSRCVIVANENGEVLYTEQVAETADEPDYQAALAALKN
ncbi:thiol peroxidase [Gayadomonas joobiniege]|uniref:thiol peroxidase n=1 Tax=Gayadomonas joobiniege TaxID=1234606 RepID=UPI00037DF7A6|nr:thiol peroxidase [Gayadomonas joobiniege]